MPQSYDEKLYIPYVSAEFPHSFPPENDEDDEARSIWHNTLTPAEKLRYKHDLDQAIQNNQSVPELAQSRRLGDGSQAEKRDDGTGEQDTDDDEDDDEIYSDSDSDSGDSQKTIRGL